MLPKVAAVTMAYNEPTYLPIWARHYARQVGADHCYIVDHGSDAIANLPPGVNIIRLPRSPHDDLKRALFISSITEGLLEYYDWVIHTDADEIVLADPQHYRDLTNFCAAAEADTITAIGFDVQQVPELEPPLAPGIPLGEQRGWVRFTSAMCKPVLTRQPLVWSPGFHCADAPLTFSGLYLFHLHWADAATGLERLAKTRVMPWGDEAYGAHQRISDGQWMSLFDGMAALKRHEHVAFDPGVPPLSGWLSRTRSSMVGREDEVYTLDLHVNADELWAIPPRFRAKL
jgi:hypothetical protein